MTPVHPLPASTEDMASPRCFTFPFCYQPHPLCVAAAARVRTYLRSQPQWHGELALGKMMGVLVVEQEGRRGFLAAFSGTLGGTAVHPYFVPPVYDTTLPAGHFAVEQAYISDINARISRLRAQHADTGPLRQQADEAVASARERMESARAERHRLRATLDARSLAACHDEMVRQSQFLKAELRRVRQHWQQILAEAEAPNRRLDQQIAGLEAERRQRSNALQDWLFGQYVFANARGEERTLLQVFDPVRPPAGAGDCCAPKLLQACYRMGCRPVCMAEFWVGRPPVGEVRVDGHFYPACHAKCRPILQFMLQGLPLDANPLLEWRPGQLREVYRASDFVVLSKPSGMLSVPGKDNLPSVYSLVQSRYPQARGPMMVHRLDMDTSGLLVVALTPEAHHRLQRLFEQRLVAKTYMALLEHPMPVGRRGTISLPLAPDLLHRPCQRVDEAHGKAALTHYRVVDNIGGHALVELVPHTGRTHQLRVHCAHHLGLGNPIVGDRLYGTPAVRLMLHAVRLAFDSYAFEDDLQGFLMKNGDKFALLG